MGIIDNIKILTGKKELKEEQPTHPTGPKKKVLIVEDEKPISDRLEAAFTDAGFVAMKAENGEVALKQIQSEKPDLIILDLLMPVMDGKLMLRKIRQDSQLKHIPVIVLTNAGEVENVRETQTYYKAEEFFIKSNVSLEEIINKAKNLTGIPVVITPTE